MNLQQLRNRRPKSAGKDRGAPAPKSAIGLDEFLAGVRNQGVAAVAVERGNVGRGFPHRHVYVLFGGVF